MLIQQKAPEKKDDNEPVDGPDENKVKDIARKINYKNLTFLSKASKICQCCGKKYTTSREGN